MPKTKRIIVAIAIAAIVISASTVSYLALYQDSSSSLPCVVDYYPKGLGVSINSKINVTFCQDMNAESVERSFYTTPAVAGDYSWADNRTLFFIPLSPFSKGVTYIITIDERAKNVDGIGLDSSIFRWYFTTEGSGSGGVIPTHRAVGQGANDFWIEYPSSHPSSGQSVPHPSWVKTSLENGVVMILDHSEGCAPCIQQSAICESVHLSYPQVIYTDLISGKTEPQASDAFRIYDPTGGINYIPLTIILTKVKDGAGTVVTGWHSWEGVVDLEILTSWINDALFYYNENT